MTSGCTLTPSADDSGGGLEDGAGLHFGDFRILDAEAATAEAEHGVELVQFVNALVHGFDRDAELLGDFLLALAGYRAAAGIRATADRASGCTPGGRPSARKMPSKSPCCSGSNLASAFLRSSNVVGEDHLADGDDAIAFEEHVLGAAEADAIGAEGDGVFDLIGLIGVGAEAELAILVGQLHQRVVILERFALARIERFADEHLLEFAVGGFDRAVEHFAGGAVDADGIAFAERDAFAGERAGVIVDVNIAGAGDADFAHLAGDQGRMAGNTAAAGENAFGSDHAAKIFRAGFDAGEDNFFAAVGPLFGLGGAEDHFARGGTGAGGQAGGHQAAVVLGVFVIVAIENRLQQLIRALRDRQSEWRARASSSLPSPCRGRFSRRPTRCACRCEFAACTAFSFRS